MAKQNNQDSTDHDYGRPTVLDNQHVSRRDPYDHEHDAREEMAAERYERMDRDDERGPRG